MFALTHRAVAKKREGPKFADAGELAIGTTQGNGLPICVVVRKEKAKEVKNIVTTLILSNIPVCCLMKS
jgi:hypothetical protein